MAKNKIVYNGTTLIDLTGDTAVESDVASGKIFHLADGTQATGTASGGGGGDTIYDLYKTGGTYENADITTLAGMGYMFANSKITNISLPNCTTLSGNTFMGCVYLTSVNLPELTTISNSNNFQSCSRLTTITFPKLETTGASTFYGCTALQYAHLPSSITIGSSLFYNCSALLEVELGPVTSVAASAFRGCRSCLKYDFTKCTVVPTLANTNAFMNINANAEIQVPAALEADWKVANNWSTYASHIVGV